MRASKAEKPATGDTVNGLRRKHFDERAKFLHAILRQFETQDERTLKHGRRRIVAWCAVPA